MPDFAAERPAAPRWPEKVTDELVLKAGPGRGLCYALALEGLRELAAWLGTDLRGAMIRALEDEVWPLRFLANRGLLSSGQQVRLLTSRVLVIGCGGLGGGVILLLARFGVGSFTLCDGDCFEETNLNRQLLCREDRIGLNKARAAAEELALVASHARVRVWPDFVGPQDLAGLLVEVDLAVDCLDNLKTRRELEAAAEVAQKPFIHGALAGLEGFFMTVKPGERALTKLYGHDYIDKSRTAESILGVPTATPTLVAAGQVHLAVRELLGQYEKRPGLWHLDLSAALLEILGL